MNPSKHYNQQSVRRATLGILFMIAMVVMVGLVVYELKDMKPGDFNLGIALFRVGVGLALIYPSVVCLRESGRHRVQEIRNRRIELELDSIDPYVERLADDKGKAIIEKLAERYFGQEQPVLPEKTPSDINPQQIGQLKNLLEVILKLTKSS